MLTRAWYARFAKAMRRLTRSRQARSTGSTIERRIFRMMRLARLALWSAARFIVRSSFSVTPATEATIAFIIKFMRGSIGTKSARRWMSMAPSMSPPYFCSSRAHSRSSSPMSPNSSIFVPRRQSSWSTKPRWPKSKHDKKVAHVVRSYAGRGACGCASGGRGGAGLCGAPASELLSMPATRLLVSWCAGAHNHERHVVRPRAQELHDGRAQSWWLPLLVCLQPSLKPVAHGDATFAAAISPSLGDTRVYAHAQRIKAQVAVPANARLAGSQ